MRPALPPSVPGLGMSDGEISGNAPDSRSRLPIPSRAAPSSSTFPAEPLASFNSSTSAASCSATGRISSCSTSSPNPRSPSSAPASRKRSWMFNGSLYQPWNGQKYCSSTLMQSRESRRRNSRLDATATVRIDIDCSSLCTAAVSPVRISSRPVWSPDAAAGAVDPRSRASAASPPPLIWRMTWCLLDCSSDWRSIALHRTYQQKTPRAVHLQDDNCLRSANERAGGVLQQGRHLGKDARAKLAVDEPVIEAQR